MLGKTVGGDFSSNLDFVLPEMVKIRQVFDPGKIGDITEIINKEFLKPEIVKIIKPGSVVAIGCGSRGIANIATIVLCVVSKLKSMGVSPFIFPCMGSHGSGTAEGQKKVLESYGISEDAMGCEIRSSVETVVAGHIDDGTPVYTDRNAFEADGIIVINRVKPHTGFRGKIESGITKMLSIGIGKMIGASTYHQHGMDKFPVLLPKIRDCQIKNSRILFGVGIVENAYDQTAHIELITANDIADREPDLQKMAKKIMPKLNFPEIDVLIIDEMGKNISGAGFDPNITGRSRSVKNWRTGTTVKRIVVLGLSKESHGNATGVGGADIITMGLYRDINLEATYANCITSRALVGASIPMVMNSDREAITLALGTVVGVAPEKCKVVRIKNTLSLDIIEVSKSLLPWVKKNPCLLEAISDPATITFSPQGFIKPSS